MFKNLLILLLLTSCGFRPLYKKTAYNDLATKTAEISISPVQGFDGQYGVELRNSLLNKLTPMGKPENPRYILDIILQLPEISDYTIKTNGLASSRQVKLTVNYSLRKKDTAQLVLSKQGMATTTYNLLNNQFSTEMLKKDAIKLALEDLSNQIYFAIITYFTEK